MEKYSSVGIISFDGLPIIYNLKSKDTDYSGSCLLLRYRETTIRNGKLESDLRFFTIEGTATELEDIIKKNRTSSAEVALQGRIVAREFKESNIPENYISHINKNVDYEEAISVFIKRKEKNILTSNGERIIRFVDYDPTGKEPDLLIESDNNFSTETLEKKNDHLYDQQNLYPNSQKNIPQTIDNKTLADKNKSINNSDIAFKSFTFFEIFKMILGAILVIAFVIMILGEMLGILDSPGDDGGWGRP